MDNEKTQFKFFETYLESWYRFSWSALSFPSETIPAKRSATTHCARWCWRHNALVRQATRARARAKETEGIEKEEMEITRIGIERNLNLSGRLSKNMITDEFPITITNPTVPAYWVTKKKDWEQESEARASMSQPDLVAKPVWSAEKMARKLTSPSKARPGDNFLSFFRCLFVKLAG